MKSVSSKFAAVVRVVIVASACAIALALVGLATPSVALAKEASVSYKAHVENIGWQAYVKDGQTAGTTGQALRMEALRVKLSGTTGSIKYSAHVANVGWQEWKSNGKTAGTTGQALAMEAVKIKLTGKAKKAYDVYYRVHSADYGWLGWAKNGSPAGTTGGGVRAEAVEIRLVKKGSAFDMGGIAFHDLAAEQAVGNAAEVGKNALAGDIKLQHHMAGSLSQQDYSAFVEGGINYGCCTMAYATGLSIITGQNVEPTQFWYGGLNHWDWGHVSAKTGYDPSTIRDALSNGYPTLVHYCYVNNSGEHWVLVVGVRAGAAGAPSYDDLIIIDPVDGHEKALAQAWKFNPAGIQGMRVFC